jgi:hypothetical protein
MHQYTSVAWHSCTSGSPAYRSCFGSGQLNAARMSVHLSALIMCRTETSSKLLIGFSRTFATRRRSWWGAMVGSTRAARSL